MAKLTPKEKAEELVDKFYPRATSFSLDRKNQYENAKQCAIISVDEILNLDYGSSEYYGILSSEEYWEQVKTEINKL
jgi:hypothetical protein